MKENQGAMCVYGWTIKDDENWKKITRQLNPQKYPYKNAWLEDVGDDKFEAVVEKAFTTLRKHLGFENIEITFEHKFAGDKTLLFGVFAEDGATADDFIEQVQKNKDAYKRVSSFLGEARFHIK
ncbi:MAG: hypothetical protein IK015_04790 [Treponema sp.]|nr:hypothetical protein [Treponema sp.]